MPAIVLYFQVHQPHRLRRYSVFDGGIDYFDEAQNADVCRKVVEKCYRPATRLLLDLVRRHGGGFRLAFSISGTALDQLQQHAPDVVQGFRDLAGTGAVEFLGETYFHSLASLYSAGEFVAQIDLHARRLHDLFGVTPRVFRNTELIYSNDLGAFVAGIKDAGGSPRYAGCLAEGTARHLAGRLPDRPYAPPSGPMGPNGRPFALLLKNDRLSDDVAFRFSNRAWNEWPLTAEKFARWIDESPGPLCNLFMDFETLGEHQWVDTGIFEFLSQLPDRVLAGKGGAFLTPAEAIERIRADEVFDVPTPTSWADTERDLSAWRGNAMQANALQEVFSLEPAVKARFEGAGTSPGDRQDAWQLLSDWRRLTTSDHFYYMSTKRHADGDVHSYFSPYESPYDAYINYMNVLTSLKARIAGEPPVKPRVVRDPRLHARR